MSANRNRAKNLVRIMRENFQSAKKELGQNDVPNLSAHLCKQPSYSTPKFVECYCNPDGPHIKVIDFLAHEVVLSYCLHLPTIRLILVQWE